MAHYDASGRGIHTIKFLHPRRGKEAIEAFGIIPVYTGVLIHDCWASYLAYSQCKHQLCGSHLLRELRIPANPATCSGLLRPPNPAHCGHFRVWHCGRRDQPFWMGFLMSALWPFVKHGAGRPGSPQEGPARGAKRPARVYRSGARGRPLWTHRGGREVRSDHADCSCSV
ncbi:IS66 family transposase [Hoeflea sp.]|uniref:IS66 family transposase n=1 Tax=Hoeflea sp. TaxID=1940281 RepID=UPI003B0244B8